MYIQCLKKQELKPADLSLHLCHLEPITLHLNVGPRYKARCHQLNTTHTTAEIVLLQFDSYLCVPTIQALIPLETTNRNTAK